MANQYNLSDVFISYSRRNIDFAKTLFKRLEDDGKEVWADWDDIPMTADWWHEIQAGIDAASTFVFIISPDSVASEICYKEVEHAAQNNKRIIPVLHIDVSREQQDKSMHEAIKTHNWVMFKEDDFEAGYTKLYKAITTDLKHVNTHSRLLVRARDWISNGYDNALLLRGNDLKQAMDWLEASRHADPAPVDDHKAYIEASRRNARVRRTVTGTGIGVILAMTALALFALFQFLSANEARIEADDARVEAEVAEEQAVLARDDAENARDLAEEQRILAEEQRSAAERAQAETVSITFANDAREQLAIGEADTALTLALLANDIEDPPVTAQQVLRQISNYSPPEFKKFNSDFTGQWAEACTVDESASCLMQQTIRQGFATLSLRDDVLLLNTQSNSSSQVLVNVSEFPRLGDMTAFAYNEQTLATLIGSENGLVIYYDLATGRVRHIFNTNITFPITEIGFDDNNNAFVRNAFGMLFRLDLTARALIDIGEAHIGAVHQATFHPTGNGRVITLGMDGQVFHWNDALAAEPIQVNGFDDFGVLHTWSMNLGQWVVVLDTGQVFTYAGTASTPLTTVDGTPLTAAIDHTQGRIAIGLFSGEITLVDLYTGATIWSRPAHEDPVTALAYHDDSNRIATASIFGEVALFDGATGQELYRLTGGHTTEVYALAFHPVANQLVSAAADGTLIVWDLDNQQIALRLDDHNSDVRSLAFVPPQRLPGLLTGTADGAVHLWDTNDWEILQTFAGHSSSVLAIDVATDGTQFVTGSNDQTVILWRLDTADEIVAQISEIRTVSEPDCDMRNEFNITPLCDPPPAPVVEVEPCTAIPVGQDSGITVRDGPGSANTLIGRTNGRPSLRVLGMEDDMNDGPIPWVRITLDDNISAQEGVEEGYIRFDFLGLRGDCSDLVYEEYVGLAPAPLADFIWARGFDETGQIYNNGINFGWDLVADLGEPIYPADGGYVIASEFCQKCGVEGSSTIDFGFSLGDSRVFSDPGWNFGYGHYVIVRYLHGQLTPNARRNLGMAGYGGSHVYCLYSNLQTMDVTQGEITNTSFPIGTVGKSGNAVGPNLNLECRATEDLLTVDDDFNWARLRAGLVDPGLIYSRDLRE